jgi:hypothetical protein
MDAEVDERRESTTSRAEWIREAIQARLDAEDAGTWDAPETDGGVDPAEA